jgi:hypothetical protein
MSVMTIYRYPTLKALLPLCATVELTRDEGSGDRKSEVPSYSGFQVLGTS